mmetsp:Transcript_113506/g.316090  ORF Transcript_113506/g.316090 Transcript_113506/m.316090 type:complete len:214 (-) Transcript_113506:684-1325(-)
MGHYFTDSGRSWLLLAAADCISCRRLCRQLPLPPAAAASCHHGLLLRAAAVSCCCQSSCCRAPCGPLALAGEALGTLPPWTSSAGGRVGEPLCPQFPLVILGRHSHAEALDPLPLLGLLPVGAACGAVRGKPRCTLLLALLLGVLNGLAFLRCLGFRIIGCGLGGAGSCCRSCGEAARTSLHPLLLACTCSIFNAETLCPLLHLFGLGLRRSS